MRVLAVQQDAVGAERLVCSLRRHRYEAVAVTTGREALALCPSSDLVLLDLDLADIDGVDICRSIRAAGDTPVIAFTERDSEVDRILGLQAGADDCLSKPYGFRELVARIEAVGRRTRRFPSEQDFVDYRGLRIDGRRREVLLDDRPVTLTRTEFELLRVLAMHAGQVVSRQELASRVWGAEGMVGPRRKQGSRTIDTHVSTLRNKLGHGRWIVTVRGVGFRMGPGRSPEPDGQKPIGDGDRHRIGLRGPTRRHLAAAVFA
ncbi:response regulator transcription factor [Micromonospora sp. KC723]|uniref:response regulator transcription factor n=1 Tax=Micromonospora sp. KC723 TaxID=2530381 RepID=UPI0010532D4A|nr:response regulator transcription factor [Micromonospora sp. KC723]TDB78132.1 response regulator transcription factor [Micromonospora sp. KC723]